MAWNGSDKERGRSVPDRRDHTDNGKRAGSGLRRPQSGQHRGLAAGLIVVIGGAAIWWFVGRSPESENQTIQQSKKSLIAEVSPQIVTNIVSTATNAIDVVEDRTTLEWHKKHDSRYFIPEGAYRDERGTLRTKTGRRILEELPRRTLYANGGKKPMFKNYAEGMIAKLLLAEPGQFFLPGNYGPNFTTSLKKALEEPTVINEDDPDDVKELKREVVEVKTELKRRMDTGEDVALIMMDCENEMRTMSSFKRDLQREVVEKRKAGDLTEQDLDDYVTAANAMLKERGMKPMVLPSVHRENLRRLRQKHLNKQSDDGNNEGVKK